MTKMIISVVAVSLLFVSCSSEEETKAETKPMIKTEIKVEPKTEKVMMKKVEAEQIIAKKVADMKSEMKKVVPSTKTGAQLYASCIGCHAANGSRKALNKSAVIQGWDAAKIANALTGYKNGTYGGSMKGVMAGQVNKLSSEDIKILSAHIATF
jgi:cytochrome c553